MAHQSAPTGHPPTTPAHAVSLKVLRLSKPSLATQTSLPPTHFGNGLDLPPKASLVSPSTPAASGFPLTPLLNVPAAFGAAYVGETFTCTLCANNEVTAADDANEATKRSVSGIRIAAELQTPSSKQAGTAVELELVGAEGGKEDEVVAPGATMQRTLRHELKEEGPHVLAVTVTYTETLHGSDGGASGGRARTFKKLYQFVAQPLMAVRSKVTERRRREGNGREWVLEGQLENVGEASVVLEKVWLGESEGVRGRAVDGEVGKEAVVLKPQDVEQVMFVMAASDRPEEKTVRMPLARLHIDWRSAMGERGSLTTGWLASRGR